MYNAATLSVVITIFFFKAAICLFKYKKKHLKNNKLCGTLKKLINKIEKTHKFSS